MQKSPEELLQSAARMAKNAHAPYSEFTVGAALLTESGEVIAGCNVENASYGLTICAERSAIFSAVAAGHRKFTAIAITAPGDNLPYPCGACRQVLAEFCDGACQVFIASLDNLNAYEQTTLGELLPKSFRMH